MIAALIRWSIKNRVLVLLVAALISAWGVYSLRTLPVDAFPDLSDVQVIIRTTLPGQTPQVVEDQLTYPLSAAMLSVSGAVAVRGYSYFGDSYVYVIFSDDTDLYWARSRVLEQLSQIDGALPKGANPQLGPDATGVGWIYEYALVDRSGKHDLSELRALQDWFLKYEVQSVPGVAEVATVGGMVKQYQVIVDPDKLRGYYLTLDNVQRAIQGSNQERGGSVLELAEAEYMVSFKGYVETIEDIGLISVPTLRRRISISSVLLDDIAQDIRVGPAARRGVAELNGEGEVVGGIVVMRSGENALTTIQGVKEKLDQLRSSLPAGVELVEIYDRSNLINEAVQTLSQRLLEEFVVVVLVCLLLLYHLRASVVILVSLPVGILAAFIVMRYQGINANIMSLGGIAIAIGAMVDAAIVMIENAQKHIERSSNDNIKTRLAAVQNAVVEVGAPLFFSLLIITCSFLPLFALEGEEARLFTPLVYTKTYAMAAAAILSITLIPALIVYLVRGKIRNEFENPLNRALIATYRPLIAAALKHPRSTLITALVMVVSLAWPLSQLGREFMPEMDEGDLLYMPTTLPGISIGKARELLQQTDRLIKTVPEVALVFGKVGRAETATDQAPLTMVETFIKLKPKDQWRPGINLQQLKQELDQRVQIPGLRNAWLMPIRARIDMQSTGINTPLGLKIAGSDLTVIEAIGQRVESLLSDVPGTSMVYAERAMGARYISVDIDRHAAAHYGLTIDEIQDAASTAVGGVDLTYVVDGRARYPVNLRYPHDMRNSIAKLKELPLIATEDTHVQLHDLAEISVVDGPPVIKSENARINSWVYITTDRDLGSYVADAQKLLEKRLNLPAGYTLNWVGQYESMQRVEKRLMVIVPIVLLVILILLYLCFQTLSEPLIVMLSVPLAFVGGGWFLYFLEYHISIAVAVGFIALMGVAVEFGVVMLIYLRQTVSQRQPKTVADLAQAVIAGAVLRMRPKIMTVAVIIAGLLPIMLGSGAGSEVMRRIAAPMIGGMFTAPLVSMVLIPVVYFLWRCRIMKASLAVERMRIEGAE